MSALRKFFALLLLSSSLAACGGGGGGSSGPAPSPPPPPPPPPPVVNPATPLPITGANALDVVPFGAGIPEAVYGISVFAGNHLAALENATGSSADVNCDSGGPTTASNADEDGSGDLSAGDTVTVSVPPGCFERVFADNVSGEFDITMDVVDRSGERGIRLEGTIEMTTDFQVDSVDPNGQPLTIAIVGDIQFAFATGSGFQQAMRVSLDAGDDLEFTVGTNLAQPAVERITRFEFLRRGIPSSGFDNNYILTYDFAIQSEILEGAISCRTTPDMSGSFPATPTSGRFQCDGAGGSAVALITTRASADDPIALEIDPDGDGTFEVLTTAAPLGWLNVIEGQLFQEFVDNIDFRPIPVSFGSVTIEAISAAQNDVVYSAANDRLYVSNPTGIIELNPATLEVLRSVNLPAGDVATTLAVSDDGSTLWFALENVDEVGRLDIATLALGARFSLGAPSGGFPDERRVIDMLVVAGTTDQVIVTVRQSEEVVAYDNGAQLPDFLEGFFREGATRIVQLDATTIVGVNDSTSAFQALTINYNPATGLTVDEVYPGLAPGFNSTLTLGTTDIWNRQGYTFSLSPAARTGRINSVIEQFPATFDAAIASPADGLVYAADGFGQLLLVFDETTRAKVGAYSADPAALGSGFVSKLLVTANELIIVADSSIGRVAKADLAPNVPADPCTVISVTDLLVDGTYDTLECRLRDVVYDSDRDLLYGALPGAVGPQGNSIVVLDPDTLAVNTYIPLTAEPLTLAMSDGGEVLTVTLAEASQIVEIDLETRTIKRTTTLGFDTFNNTSRSDPIIPTATRARPGFPDQVVVADWQSDVYLYDSGVRQPISAFARNTYSRLFFSTTDSSLVFGHLSGRLGTLQLNGSGVDFLSETDNVLESIAIARRGNRLLSGRGQELDLGTLIGSQACNFEPPNFGFRAPAYSSAADTAFFAESDGGRHLLYRCNLDTGEVGDAVPVPLFAESTTDRPFALYQLNSGELVYLHEGTLLKLSAPQ